MRNSRPWPKKSKELRSSIQQTPLSTPPGQPSARGDLATATTPKRQHQTDAMLKQAITRYPSRPSRQPLTACLRCQWRTINTKTDQPIPNSQTGTFRKVSGRDHSWKHTPNQDSLPDQLAAAPRSWGKRVDAFEPGVLLRPIGMLNPPRAGENTGVDLRTFMEKRKDFSNMKKHLEKREKLCVHTHSPPDQQGPVPLPCPQHISTNSALLRAQEIAIVPPLLSRLEEPRPPQGKDVHLAAAHVQAR